MQDYGYDKIEFFTLIENEDKLNEFNYFKFIGLNLAIVYHKILKNPN